MLEMLPFHSANFFRSCIVSLALCCLCLQSQASAQVKYKNPEDPRVKEIATRAAEYLRTTSGELRYRAVSALALIEYHKRYEGRVPTEDPFVKKLVEELAKKADKGSAVLMNNREVYFPCVAIITLLEYDEKKYALQAQKILNALLERQLDDGGFTYQNEKIPDTSQAQFAALAMFVAKQHRISIEPKKVGRLLQFFVDYQRNDGSWSYRPRIGEASGTQSVSIHSASASSVLLLADMLNLTPRTKDLSTASSTTAFGQDLPKNISVYVPPHDEESDFETVWASGGKPVVKFDKNSLRSCRNSADQWYVKNFVVPLKRGPWNPYYMYALERYAFFKEQADGNPGKGLSRWYDTGVDYLAGTQAGNGALPTNNRNQAMPDNCATGLSLLFLVRASEVINLPPTQSQQDGDEGFGTGNLVQDSNGQVVNSDAEKSLKDLISALSDKDLDERALLELRNALKRSVREFRQESGSEDRGKTKAFLETMLGAKNYLRRRIAITFLAGEQNLDNVPALLYGIGDPNLEVALEAHNGLRLISRRIDEFQYTPTGDRERDLEQFQVLKRKWTKWYLSIRPDADLLD